MLWNCSSGVTLASQTLACTETSIAAGHFHVRHGLYDIHDIHGFTTFMGVARLWQRRLWQSRYPAESPGIPWTRSLRQSRSFTPGPSFTGVSRAYSVLLLLSYDSHGLCGSHDIYGFTRLTDFLFQDISPFWWSKAAERDVNRGIDTASEKLEWPACVAGTHAA